VQKNVKKKKSRSKGFKTKEEKEHKEK